MRLKSIKIISKSPSFNKEFIKNKKLSVIGPNHYEIILKNPLQTAL